MFFAFELSLNITSRLVMKYACHMIVIVLLPLAACRQSPKKTVAHQQPPKALEGKQSSVEMRSSWNYGDLVEKLYDELAATDQELRALEERIDALNESKADSIESFTMFDQKNHSYYEVATNYANRITDSALKNELKSVVAASMEKYNASVSAHKKLLELIEQKEEKLDDLHSVLMVVKTLPVMEQYQLNNKPKISSLQGFAGELDTAIRMTDIALKK